MREYCAVVIGGYVNGVGIVTSLREAGYTAIAVIGLAREPILHMPVSERFIVADYGPEALLPVLTELGETYSLVIPFPTSDEAIESLAKISNMVSSFVFFPFRSANLLAALDKDYQYEACGRAGISVPNYVSMESVADLDLLRSDKRYIVKPPRSTSLQQNPFRAVVVPAGSRGDGARSVVRNALDSGSRLLACEYVPGADSQIVALTCYRAIDGRIGGWWVGQKISQSPPTTGAFSIAIPIKHEVVFEMGVRAIEAVDVYGICQVEFKLDPVDGTPQLMELSLRSDMWHRVGALCGVNIPADQMRDALNRGLSSESPTWTGTGPVLVNITGEFTNMMRSPRHATRTVRAITTHRPREFALWTGVPWQVRATVVREFVALGVNSIRNSRSSIAFRLGKWRSRSKA